MADSPGQRMSGILGPRFRGAMAAPQEDVSVKLARLLQGMGPQPQAPTPAYQQPFTGLRNEPAALPPFVPPGGAMEEAIGPGVPFTPPRAPPPPPTAAGQPQALPGASPAPPQLPEAPVQVPPMPPPTTVRDDVIAAAQQLLAQNLLPEQWKGAFTNQYGAPR